MLKELMTQPTEEFGRWTRFLIFQLRLWRQCGKLLIQNRSGTQAAALSYHTIFGIVPLAIVMLMVFQAFPEYKEIGYKVRTFVYELIQLNDIRYPVTEEGSDQEKMIVLTDQINQITDSFISKLDKGTITLFSGAIVIWAALGLLGTIERSFNAIWRCPRNRSFMHRIVNYWALLTMGPLLIGLGFYASTQFAIEDKMQEGILKIFQTLLPYLISVIGFFFLYFVMPNTKVSVRAAVWAACVSALIWAGAKFVFGLYLTKFIPYQAVYGVLGLIPLAVVWIYITWLIVLFGLQLAYATQHLKTLDAAEFGKMQKTRENFIASDITVFQIMAYILEQFEADKCPVTSESVAAQMEMPPEFSDKILNHLVTSELLFATTEPRAGYTPSSNAEHISLLRISRALQNASFIQSVENDKLKEVSDSYADLLAKYSLKDVIAQNKS